MQSGRSSRSRSGAAFSFGLSASLLSGSLFDALPSLLPPAQAWTVGQAGLLALVLGLLAGHLGWSWVQPKARDRALAWVGLVACLCSLAAADLSGELDLSGPYQPVEPPAWGETLDWGVLAWTRLRGLTLACALPFGGLGLLAAGWSQRPQHARRDLAFALIGLLSGALAHPALLAWFSGPDLGLVAALLGAIGAMGLSLADRRATDLSLQGLVAACLLALTLAAAGGNLLGPRPSASAEDLRFVSWSSTGAVVVEQREGVARVLEGPGRGGPVVVDTPSRVALAGSPSYALPYRYQDRTGRVAVIGGQAGAAVAIAQHLGYTEILNYEPRPAAADLVERWWPDALLNPFRTGQARRVYLDGVLGVRHGDERFSVIQVVWPYLNSALGQLAQGGRPDRMFTQEAFQAFHAKLLPSGVLAVAAGPSTRALLPTAAAALRARGSTNPGDHLFYVGGEEELFLMQKRPFSREERDRLVELVNRAGQFRVLLDPVDRDLGMRSLLLDRGPVASERRPYPGDRRTLGWAMLVAPLKRLGLAGAPTATDFLARELWVGLERSLLAVFAVALSLLLRPAAGAGRRPVTTVVWSLVLGSFVAAVGMVGAEQLRRLAGAVEVGTQAAFAGASVGLLLAFWLSRRAVAAQPWSLVACWLLLGLYGPLRLWALAEPLALWLSPGARLVAAATCSVPVGLAAGALLVDVTGGVGRARWPLLLAALLAGLLSGAAWTGLGARLLGYGFWEALILLCAALAAWGQRRSRA